MNHQELKDDIAKAEEALRHVYDIDTRMAIIRLIEVLRSWKVSIHIKESHGRKA